MKKLVFLFCISLFMLSCEKEEVKKEEFPFTTVQKHAYNVLNGKFTDTSIYSTGYGADIINFYNVYATPLVEYYTDGTVKNIFFGECNYYDAYAKTTSYYYYYILENSDAIALYNKSDKKIYEFYDIILIDESSFYMQDPDLSVPYKFVKQ